MSQGPGNTVPHSWLQVIHTLDHRTMASVTSHLYSWRALLAAVLPTSRDTIDCNVVRWHSSLRKMVYCTDGERWHTSVMTNTNREQFSWSAVALEYPEVLIITWGPNPPHPSGCVPTRYQRRIAGHLLTLLKCTPSSERFMVQAAEHVRGTCPSVAELRYCGTLVWRSQWFVTLFVTPPEDMPAALLT
jgi:hypothetical protein